MYTSFNKWATEHLPRHLSTTTKDLIIAPDSSFLRNVPASFLSSPHPEYKIAMVSGVKEELDLHLKYLKLRKPRFYDSLSQSLSNINEIIDVKISPAEEYQISSAAIQAYSELTTKQKRNNREIRSGELGNADMQQIALALQRHNQGLQTLIFSDDIGILATLKVLNTSRNIIPATSLPHLAKYAA